MDELSNLTGGDRLTELLERTTSLPLEYQRQLLMMAKGMAFTRTVVEKEKEKNTMYFFPEHED